MYSFQPPAGGFQPPLKRKKEAARKQKPEPLARLRLSKSVQKLLPTLDVTVDHLGEIGFTDRTHALLYHLAAFEQQQRGNPADVVSHGRIAIGIHVNLAHF